MALGGREVRDQPDDASGHSVFRSASPHGRVGGVGRNRIAILPPPAALTHGRTVLVTRPYSAFPWPLSRDSGLTWWKLCAQIKVKSCGLPWSYSRHSRCLALEFQHSYVFQPAQISYQPGELVHFLYAGSEVLHLTCFTYLATLASLAFKILFSPLHASSSFQISAATTLVKISVISNPSCSSVASINLQPQTQM